MKIGILVAGHFLRSEDGIDPDNDVLFHRLLDGHGFEFETWNVVDMEFPPGVDAADGWLITGSKWGAYDAVAFIPPLEDFIRKAFAAKVPMVGICFGHQIIAQAMGGRVEKFEGGWRTGPETYRFGDETVHLTAWHQDQVVEVPEGAEVIGQSDFCATAALVYGSQALTIQPHPEFGRSELDALIEVRGPNLPSELMDRVRRRADLPLANSVFGDRIAAFFKVAHGQ